MGHANIWKFNTKVLNFYEIGFLEKSNITESIGVMFILKPNIEQILDLRAKVLIFQEFEFLENLMDIERKQMLFI